MSLSRAIRDTLFPVVLKKPFCLNLEPAVIAQADELAVKLDSSRSAVAREALVLGLRALERRRIQTGEYFDVEIP